MASSREARVLPLRDWAAVVLTAAARDFDDFGAYDLWQLRRLLWFLSWHVVYF